MCEHCLDGTDLVRVTLECDTVQQIIVGLLLNFLVGVCGVDLECGTGVSRIKQAKVDHLVEFHFQMFLRRIGNI